MQNFIHLIEIGADAKEFGVCDMLLHNRKL